MNGAVERLEALKYLTGLGARMKIRPPRSEGPVVPVGMPAMSSRGPVWPVSAPATSAGFGDAGASQFTMAAAEALDEHLTTNTCAGCDDMKSSLRQLTFAFKAAALTDTATLSKVNLNMSTVLAMTGFGPGTDAALSLILGQKRTYGGGPCTDDAGNCRGTFVTPTIPSMVATLEANLAKLIARATAFQQITPIPQAELVPAIIQGFAALINQIGFELAKLKGGMLVEPKPTPPVVTPPPPAPIEKPPPTTTPAAVSAWTTGEKIAAGAAVVVVVAGVAAIAYRASKKRR